MPATRSTVRRRLLGAELRRAREATGMTLKQAAVAIGRTDASLSRIENGIITIRALDAMFLLDSYGFTDPPKRKALATLAQDGRKRGWWQTYADLLAPEYADLISLEADATLARSFQLVLVPGLLQTEEYARIIADVAPPQVTQEEIEGFVQVRMARQLVLRREKNPLQFDIVLGEAALHQMIGGPEVMKSQLRKLARMSETPNVTLRVLPFSAGAHPALPGPFAYLRFPEPAPIEVVVLENMTSSLYLEQEVEISEYARAFERLERLALGPDDSLALITRMGDNL